MLATDASSTGKQADAGPAHPLWALWQVTAWEARRTVARPTTWLLAVAVFAIFALVMDSRAFCGGTWGWGDGRGLNLQASIPYGSAMQVYYDLPFNFLFPLVLVVVFLAADGVARDWQRRTHELVMAAALPTWAYVWGRYLVVLALSLCFAVEMLLAILLVVAVKHATVGGACYPAPRVGPVLATWAALALPATIFAGGLSFALGTLFFRATTLVKLAIALGWFLWMGALPAITQGNPDVPQWVLRWDPTYVGLVRTGLYDLYDGAMTQLALPLEGSGHTVSQAQLLDIFHRLVYELPDVASWLPPHLVWALLAVGLVAAVSRVFKRYQNAAR
jgi:ABC-type transport system involved in multi-copper enzyme maturation permease subunit